MSLGECGTFVSDATTLTAVSPVLRTWAGSFWGECLTSKSDIQAPEQRNYQNFSRDWSRCPRNSPPTFLGMANQRNGVASDTKVPHSPRNYMHLQHLLHFISHKLHLSPHNYLNRSLTRSKYTGDSSRLNLLIINLCIINDLNP